jgi:hypothetical protein
MAACFYRSFRVNLSTYHISITEPKQHALQLAKLAVKFVVLQYDHPWNPQMRTTTETVLREAMQALVRVQAHMLARIVVEIRAADTAVELGPQL